MVSFPHAIGLSWRRHWPLLAVLVLGAVLILMGLMTPGIGEDSDAPLVVRHASHLSTLGYTPIRSWGFPLYELYTYPLLNNFGDVVARLPAGAFYLATIILVYRFCLPSQGETRSALTALAVAVVPTIHLPASELMETSMSLFLGLAFILAVLKWRAVTSLPGPRELFLLALLGALATGVRPDNIILFAAFGIAAVMQARRLPARLILAGLLFLAVVAGIFAGVYSERALNGIFNFGMRVLQPDPWSRRVLRAILGYAAAVGLPFLAFFIIALWRRRLPWPAGLDKGERWFLLLAAGLWALRYATLPDEVSYLVIPVSAQIVVLCNALPKGPVGRGWLLGAVTALALPNLVQIALFERPHLTAEFRPSLQPGALQQDLGYRRSYQAQWQLDQDLISHPERIGCARVRVTLPNSEPPADTCLVLNRFVLRYLDRGRGQVAQRQREILARLTRVFVYDGAAGRGWHHFLPYETLTVPDIQRLTATTGPELLSALDRANDQAKSPPSP